MSTTVASCAIDFIMMMTMLLHTHTYTFSHTLYQVHGVNGVESGRLLTPPTARTRPTAV